MQEMRLAHAMDLPGLKIIREDRRHLVDTHD